jgi:hypothetical protein
VPEQRKAVAGAFKEVVRTAILGEVAMSHGLLVPDDPDQVRDFLIANPELLDDSKDLRCYGQLFTSGVVPDLGDLPTAAVVAHALVTSGNRLRSCGLVVDPASRIAHVVPAGPGFPKVHFAFWAAAHPHFLVGATPLVNRILSSNHSDTIVGENLNRYRASQAKANAVCSSILTPSERSLLDAWSIPVSDFPTSTIPHPVLKALENHRNENLLPPLLAGRVNFVSTKMSKIRKIRALCPNADIRVFNPIITPADRTRYTEPADLPPHPVCDIIVFDDCLHHLAPNVVAAYAELWDCQRVLGTFISPPESWEKLASVLPELYQLQYLPGDRFLFMPTDNNSQSYEQVIGDCQWYDLGSFSVGDADYDVELLQSYGPYHFVSIIRDMVDPVRRTHRSFDVPDVIRLPNLPGFENLHSPWFPHKLYLQGLFHAGSLRKLGQSDILARFRGLANTSQGCHVPLATWEVFAVCCRVSGLKLSLPSEILFLGNFLQRTRLALFLVAERYLPPLLLRFLFEDLFLARLVGATLHQDHLSFVVPLRHNVEMDPYEIALPVPPAVPEVPQAPPPPPITVVQLPPQNERLMRAQAPRPGPIGRVVLNTAPVPWALPPLGPSTLPLFANSARPGFIWTPNRRNELPDVPNSCGFEVLREILDDQYTDLFHERLIAALPEAELLMMTDRDLPTSSAVLFAAAGLLLGLSFRVHVPGSLPTVYGADVPPTGDIFGVVLPTGARHWQGHPDVQLENHGNVRDVPVDQWTGGALMTPAESFFNQINAEGFQPILYQYDAGNAKLLFNEMSEGIVGIVRTMDKWPENVRRFRAAVDRPRINSAVPLLYFSGVAGCGKSRRVRDVLVNRRNEISWWLTLVSPLNALCREWLSHFPNPSKEIKVGFKTHERALFNSPQLLIIDEAQKLPGHYLDFYLATHPDVTHVILLGDPYQCGPPVTTSASVIPSHCSPGIALSPFIHQYLCGSWRVNSHVATALNIPVYHGRRSTVSVVNRIPRDLPVIVTTLNSQAVVKHYGRDAFTLSSCGGLDFPGPYTIVVGREVLTGVPSEAIYTAFTRSRADIYVYYTLTPAEMVRAMVAQPLLRAIMQGVPLVAAFQTFMSASSPPPASIVSSPVLWYAGTLVTVADVLDDHDIVSKYDDLLEPTMRNAMLGPPALRALSDTSPVPLEHAEPMREWVPTMFPRSAAPMHDLGNSGFAREGFEFFSERHGAYSHVFDDSSPSENIHNMTDMFSRHQAKDEALFGPTLDKRLRFETHEQNEKELQDLAWLGPLLMEAFSDLFALPEDIPWDEELFDHCVDHCARHRLSKETSSLNNLAQHQDPDLRDNYTVLNMLKAQLINKLDTITRYQDGVVFPKVKPAQMLTTYTEEINAIFGPLTRYLSVKLRQVSGRPNVMLYGGMSHNDLAQWCRTHVKEEVPLSFANDFTQYDKSVRADSLNFEIQIMRVFNVPEHFIALHEDLTCHLKSSFGPLGLQRTSGQWCTYLFNSWFGAAYFKLRYDFDELAAMGFSGDDMFIQYIPYERTAWASLKKFFCLEDKPVVTRWPDFCGWTLTHMGPIRSGRLLAFKLQYHEGHSTLPKVLISYYLEWSVGVALGDSLHELLDPEDLMWYGWLHVFFQQYRAFVPSFLENRNLLGSEDFMFTDTDPIPWLSLPGFRALEWHRLPPGIQKILLGFKNSKPNSPSPA